MFGYFKFLKRYSDYETQKVYKNYYCGLCFALEVHYGQLSRMLLSYDVTVWAVAMHAHACPTCEKLSCVLCKAKKKEIFKSETWKKIAAINILLAAENLQDDIEDEKSWKAAVARQIFARVIKKAKKDFPKLAQTIHVGYKKIQLAEKEKKDVLHIGNCFADLMVSAVDAAFCVPDHIRDYAGEISRWLYFIDALDDYDEDIAKGRFNPLSDGNNFTDFVDKNYMQIQAILASLYEHHPRLVAALNDGSCESEILKSILTNTIPAMTSMALLNAKTASAPCSATKTLRREKV